MLLGAIAMGISLLLLVAGNKGMLSFIPGDGVYLIQMLVPIIGTIALGMLLEKRKLKKVKLSNT